MRYPRSKEQDTFRVIPQVAADTLYEPTTPRAMVHTWSKEKSAAAMARTRKPLVRPGVKTTRSRACWRAFYLDGGAPAVDACGVVVNGCVARIGRCMLRPGG